MVLNQIQSVYSDVPVVPCSADFLLEVKTGPVVIKKGVGECWAGKHKRGVVSSPGCTLEANFWNKTMGRVDVMIVSNTPLLFYFMFFRINSMDMEVCLWFP